MFMCASRTREERVGSGSRRGQFGLASAAPCAPCTVDEFAQSASDQRGQRASESVRYGIIEIRQRTHARTTQLTATEFHAAM